MLFDELQQPVYKPDPSLFTLSLLRWKLKCRKSGGGGGGGREGGGGRGYLTFSM